MTGASPWKWLDSVAFLRSSNKIIQLYNYINVFISRISSDTNVFTDDELSDFDAGVPTIC